MYKQRSFSNRGFRDRNDNQGFRRGNGGRRFGGYGNRNSGGGNRIKSFDPSQVVASSVSVTQTMEIETVNTISHSFNDFNLTPRLLNNVLSHGYTIPTPIQDQAIPEIMNGRDVVGVANTGTGKTAAFLIPLLNKIEQYRNSKVLIIAPTRELAAQIEMELQNFARGLGIYSAICIGGVPIRGQIFALNRNPHFVIGTPGRLLDLYEQRKINFNQYSCIVMDEVDRMLDMGFVKDVEKIVSNLPRVRQSLFFSATLDANVTLVMKRFVQNPVHISVKTKDITTNVSQAVIKLNGREKIQVLREILDQKDVTKTLVFSRTKHGADKISKSLLKENFQTAVLHGNKTQGQRQKALDFFKRGKISILIATDVASRGIDVNDISHVINFDLPASYEDYIHRIGRTGRANKKGNALTFF
ncbi:MAG: ATP-dependent RNA helicase rhlB [Parcubacteria group bacterium GW2011_GWA1_38_7]|nr:MAG: ATP-dependent RNA helicase rhlB [Parcubacteria group bacterium GW2011_GWA1_38_7]